PPRTSIYTLSLHDALPIFGKPGCELWQQPGGPENIAVLCRIEVGGRGSIQKLQIECVYVCRCTGQQNEDDILRFVDRRYTGLRRSEEHTSELQSRSDLVCR